MSSGAKSTVISNQFIDKYMPKANGSYVKIYVYLLRCISDVSSDMSLSYIADRLDETEKDITRALKYWEEAGAISIKKDTFGRITDITILNLERSRTAAEELSPAAPETPVVPLFQNTAEKEAPFGIEEVSAYSGIPDQRPTYSDAQVSQLLEADEIKWLLQMLEHHTGRLFKASDIQLLLYFYECLGFSADLIVYLYDYCLDRGKKNNAYIEKVAVSWASEGINTVELAKEQSALRNDNFSAVMKAFGFNRAPAPAEQQFLQRWFETFSFSSPIVVEACNRTMLSIGKPDFKYTDKILENWYKEGIKDSADLQNHDREHAKSASSGHSNITRPFQFQTANPFNRFPQRKYSEEDYSDMEQRLLNKQQG